MSQIELGFPWWLRLTHWFNVLFLTLLVRSGLEILSAHPKVYWNDDCTPGTAWLKFTRKVMPADRLWASTDEEEHWSPWTALPGGSKLGLGRYWHFTSVLGWMIVGLLYLVMLFTTIQWRQIVPTSWRIVPEALHDLLTYLSFRLPPEGTSWEPTSPYNALQQLTYFLIIFWLTPHMIVTGLAMSPALEGRFAWFPKLFFGRQPARTFHFLGMVAFVTFLVIHVAMVVIHGFAKEMDQMVLGQRSSAGSWQGAALGLAIIAGIVVFHVVATVSSHRWPRAVHRLLSAIVDPPRRFLFHHIRTIKSYPDSEISPFFRMNGYPPTDEYPKTRSSEYVALQQNGFVDWRLEVTGLVETPLSLALPDLRALPRTEQTTMHNCIQGWTCIGKWSGVHLTEILKRCQPRPEAKFLVFRSYQIHEKSGLPYYECIDLELARHPQTILAYEFNGKPLPIPHGAPLRLRCENQLGFKMVKYLRAIEFVEDYRQVGEGMGGIREDHQQFNLGAEI